MGKQRQKKIEARQKRRADKKRAMKSPGHQSNYAKKKAFLASKRRKLGFHVWGFDYPTHKPWKGSR